MPKRWWTPYAIVTILLLPIVLPLYAKTILGSADNLAHLFRVVNLDAALSQGYIWPRWASLEAHGYGAPIFNFNYMLPYFIIRFFWQLTGSLLHGSQLFMMATLLGSAFGMYVFVASLFSVSAAILAAVVYAYMPYHLMTVYLYGGYGEALAFVWLPLFAYFYVQFIKAPSKRWNGVLAVVMLALLILTHNLSALMAIPFIYSLVFVVSSDVPVSVRIRNTVISAASSILLTTWFWLPSIAEQQYTKLSVLFEKETALRRYFFQMIAPIVENSFSALRLIPPSYYSYAIGIPTILIFCFTTLFLFQQIMSGKGWKEEKTRIGIFYLTWFIVTLGMTRAWSEPLWKLLPAQMNFLSYPYRFFFLNAFATAILAGFVLTRLRAMYPQNITNLFSVGLIAFTVWQGVIYAHPAIDRFGFGETYFSYEQTVREAPFTHKNMGYIEFIPRTADSDFVNGLDGSQAHPRVEIISGQGSVELTKQQAQDLYIRVLAEDSVQLRVNILYFPGWQGVLHGVKKFPKVDAQGRMIFVLPKGRYEFHVSFQNTPVRIVATYISIISFGALLLVYIFCFSKDISRRAQARGLR